MAYFTGNCVLTKTKIEKGYIDVEGNIYEKNYILNYLTKYRESPVSNIPLSICDLKELLFNIDDIIVYNEIIELNDSINELNNNYNGKFKSNILSCNAENSNFSLFEFKDEILKWYEYFKEKIIFCKYLCDLKNEDNKYQFDLIFINIDTVLEFLKSEIFKIYYDFNQVKNKINEIIIKKAFEEESNKENLEYKLFLINSYEGDISNDRLFLNLPLLPTRKRKRKS